MRYNPEGDAAMNRRQAERLKRLSDYLHSGGRSQFMFELLVPATAGTARAVRRRQEGVRPGASARADGAGDPELQDAGIEPDVWKIEGIDRSEDCGGSSRRLDAAGAIASAASSLAAARTTTKVRQWLKTAAAVPGFIGFAVGRTSFWGP